jgi:hypothetical protein
LLLIGVRDDDDCLDIETPFYQASEAIREAEKGLLTAFIKEKTFDAIPCLLKPIGTVRQTATRMQVIQKTRCIPAGYTIVDSMMLIILFLMTLSDWPMADRWHSVISYTMSITFLFVYLRLLIRAVEDPISYSGDAISGAFATRSYTGRAHNDPAGARPWLANLWTIALSCWESAGACTAICLVVCHLPRNSQIGLNQCPRRLKRICCSQWKHVKGETRCRTEGSDLGPFPCWAQRASERDADSLQRERDTE